MSRTTVTTPAPERRRWSTKRKVALQLLLLPIALLAVEGIYRAWLASRGETYAAGRAAAEIEEIPRSMTRTLAAFAVGDTGEPVDASVVLHPYLGFDVVVAGRGFARELKYFADEKSDSVYDIVLVGGSVAAVFGNEVSAQFAEELRQDPRFRSRPVHVISEARAGFKEPQQLNLVAYLINLGFKPDAVINLDGFNELALSNYNAHNGAHPDLPSIAHWGSLAAGRELDKRSLDLLAEMHLAQRDAEAVSARALSLGLAKSACLGRMTLARLSRERARYARAQDEYARAAASRITVPMTAAPPFKDDIDSVVALSVANWFESSRSLDAICRARGIQYLHALQPTLHDEGSKPLTAAEVASSAAHEEWIAAVHAGYALLRERGPEFAAAGVHFADLSRVFADVHEDLYFDACHFNRAGNLILAHALARAFLDSLPPR